MGMGIISTPPSIYPLSQSENLYSLVVDVESRRSSKDG